MAEQEGTVLDDSHRRRNEEQQQFRQQQVRAGLDPFEPQDTELQQAEQQHDADDAAGQRQGKLDHKKIRQDGQSAQNGDLYGDLADTVHRIHSFWVMFRVYRNGCYV